MTYRFGRFSALITLLFSSSLGNTNGVNLDSIPDAGIIQSINYIVNHTANPEVEKERRYTYSGNVSYKDISTTLSVLYEDRLPEGIGLEDEITFVYKSENGNLLFYRGDILGEGKACGFIPSKRAEFSIPYFFETPQEIRDSFLLHSDFLNELIRAESNSSSD